ncbi:MAG: tetratricopeptide repeat protein [Proteobacteria bacterium]|nr:tetratricopeptide repeat protein [Pseudomonadota bacterium]
MTRLARPLILVASVLVSLLLCELIVRIAGLGPGVRIMWVSSDDTVYQRSENPILGFELKPNYRNPNADLNESYPRINAHGQRDVERQYARTAGVRRIALLGDSLVEGHGVREIEDIFSQQLERTWADGEVEVLNFGVSGYNTRAEIETLRTKGLKYNPDLVILVFAKNDFDDFLREAFELGSVVERPRWVKGLFSASSLFRMLAVRFDWWELGADADPSAHRKEVAGQGNVAEGLRLLNELAREHDFQAFVVAWPEFEDDGIRDVQWMPDESELVIERLARSAGLSTFRLSDGFRRDWQSRTAENPRQLYSLGDGVHPSVEGSRVAAQVLRSVIDGFDPEEHGVREPSGEDAEAAAVALSLSGRDPGLSAVANNRGAKLYRQGDLDGAEREIRHALELNAEYADAHHNLGLVLAARGQHTEAMKHYREAVRLAPLYASAYNNLGLSLATTGQITEAEAMFRKAIRIDDDYAPARGNLGTALRLQGRLGPARRAYEAAVAADPQYADGYRNLGLLLFQQQNFTGAIAPFQRLAELEPGNADTLANLGAALQASGRRTEALDAYRRALAINPNQAAARQNLAALQGR